MNNYLRKNWQQSKPFRIIVIIVLLYALLRLCVHGVFLSEVLKSSDMEGHDLQVYLDAATRFELQQDLYPKGELTDWIEFYQYSPAYALLFTLFLRLPVTVVMVLLSILHIVAYIALYWRWDQIFKQLDLQHARETLAWLLPIWLIFSQFWADLGYLNVYIFMALAATLLIDAILKERLGWALLWLSLILQTKPQWAFPLVLPLLLGHRRFFFKLLIGAVAAYAAILGTTMLLGGLDYIWQQQIDYVRLLGTLSSGNYPWRGPNAPFLGYNHSIAQIVVYLLGISQYNLNLATGIQVLLLIPLGIISLRYLLKTNEQTKLNNAEAKLDLACAFYLGAFIWLDVVWEITLSIAVFTYLLATTKQKNTKVLIWIIFMAYALIDIWQLMSFIVFGEDVLLSGLYVATDPSIYIPLTMMVILTFYAILVRRLWARPIYSMRGKEQA